VEEPFRHLRPPDRVQKPDGGDPEAVREHRHRDRGQDQDRPFPERRPEVVRDEDPERKEREQVAQTGAGIDHLELGKPQVDDVPFTVRGHPE